MIIVIFFENMAIDAFLACLFICSLFNIFVYGPCICIYLNEYIKKLAKCKTVSSFKKKQITNHRM